MSGKFELKKAKDGQFHFNLLATNGQVILSSEMYKAKDSALNGIESVRKNSQREGAFETKPRVTTNTTSCSWPPTARWSGKARCMPAPPVARAASSRCKKMHRAR